MRSKKLLLSEEISRMAEIFSHMGINLLMEGRLLGREAGTGVEALVPGSTIRNLVGETTAKNIEDDLIRAAQQSQNVMRQLGKNIGDTITMDDLETAFFAANKAATAAKVLDAMEPAGAKSFMDNTANYIFNKNSSTSVTRAGTTDASLQTLNSLIKRDMSVVTADNILNNISTFRNAIDNLADDTQKANWKKSLDLAETQAKTVKLKPTETTGPTPGPSPRPVIGDEPYNPTPAEQQLGDDLDTYFNNTPPPTTMEELESAIEKILYSMRDSGYPVPPHIKWDELIEQTKVELKNVPNVGVVFNKEGVEKWNALGPAKQKQLVERAKAEFPAPKVPENTTGQEILKKWDGIRGFLFNRFFNKQGRISWGAVYGYGVMVAAVECLTVKGLEIGWEVNKASQGQESEIKDTALELAGCIAMSAGTWLGLVGNILLQTGVISTSTFTSYENTVESFEQFLKDNDIKYVSAQQDSEGVNQYYYIPEGDGEGVTYEFKNNTFEKK